MTEHIPNGVRLSQPPEPLTHIRKRMTLELDAHRAALTLRHSLENTGTQSIELAPWALTMLKLGGIAILPQTTGAVDEHGLLPNRNLVLWQYTRINDPRLEWHDDVVRLHARAELPPCKIGYLNRAGWMAYWRNAILFVKRFTPQPNALYPDLNCNAEVYCNDEFIELETLAPMQRLEPQQSVEHTETWEFYSDVHTLEQIQERIK